MTHRCTSSRTPRDSLGALMLDPRTPRIGITARNLLKQTRDETHIDEEFFSSTTFMVMHGPNEEHIIEGNDIESSEFFSSIKFVVMNRPNEGRSIRENTIEHHL